MTGRLRSFALMLAAPVAAVVFSMVLSAIILLAAGSNPITAFGDMLENGTRLGTTAHRCLRLDERPKRRWPKKARSGTTSPSNGPATYHGHGPRSRSRRSGMPPRVHQTGGTERRAAARTSGGPADDRLTDTPMGYYGGPTKGAPCCSNTSTTRTSPRRAT